MEKATIIIPAADVYREHTFTSEVITQALLGEQISILNTHDNWTEIEQWDGYKGWINNFCLSSNPNMEYIWSVHIEPIEHLLNPIPVHINAQSSAHLFPDNLSELTIRKEVGSDCAKFLHVPYRWGGKSNFGFDCSGLVQTTFKMNGISIPRDSKDQYELVKNNKIMPLEYAKTGDLIFFQENNKICHVAIYCENLKFIHCSGMVKFNSLDKEHQLFDKRLMDKFVGVFSMSEIIKEQLNE